MRDIRINKTEELDAAWDVFEVSPGTFQIQRNDENAPASDTPADSPLWDTGFVSDFEAIGYAFLSAITGDAEARTAFLTCYGIVI